MTREPTSIDSAAETALSPRERRRAIRQRYGSLAGDADGERGADGGADDADNRTDEDEPTRREASCCEEPQTERSSCCGDAGAESRSRSVGYSRDELESVADGANLGLGCGNPNAVAELSEGETVLDLGSGGGFDCFLAAREVGDDGRVIGVDMTPEMVERARANVEENGVDNVEFRLGEIKHLPVPDERVDAIISNCVVNLSPEKRRVFEEAYRVLRPGGRLAIADVVRTADVPPDLVPDDPASVAGCVAGASSIDDLEETVERAGFRSASIRPIDGSEEFIREWSDEHPLEAYFASAVIEGRKPREVDE